MPLAIAEAPSHLSRNLLLRVDRDDDQRISLDEVDAYASQPFVTRYESQQLQDLRQAVLGAGTPNAGAPQLPPDRRTDGGAPSEDDGGWFSSIGDFFASALKWLGDLGDTRLFQGLLMGAGVAGWFFPGIAVVAGFLGALTSASSILSGLIHDDREVNWWHLPVGLLHAAGMAWPLSGASIVGGGLGAMTVRESS